MSTPARIEITGGGTPSPQEAAAIAAAVEFLVAGSPIVSDLSAGPAANEWALQGRLADLHWAPLSQRWPGEPSGRNWRRVLS